MMVYWVAPENRGTVPSSLFRGLSQGLHGLRSAKVAAKFRKGLARAEEQVVLGQLPPCQPYLLDRAEDSQWVVAASPIAAQELM